MPATLSRLRADHLEQPLALRRRIPRLTWCIEGEAAQPQAAYRIVLSGASDHDTGWVDGSTPAALTRDRDGL